MLTATQVNILRAHSTPFLIKAMRGCYIADWEVEDYSKWRSESCNTIDGMKFTYADIKEFLNTRPHVKNKQENRADIAARKKAGISRKK